MKKDYIRDELSGLEYVPLELNDTFSLECIMCGKCCCNVSNAIPLESLDVFRISKFLGKRTDEIMLDYTDMHLISEAFPMLFLKTKSDRKHKGQCIFLESARCQCQPSKPRTCRLYAKPRIMRSIGKQHTRYRNYLASSFA